MQGSSRRVVGMIKSCNLSRIWIADKWFEVLRTDLFEMHCSKSQGENDFLTFLQICY